MLLEDSSEEPYCEIVSSEYGSSVWERVVKLRKKMMEEEESTIHDGSIHHTHKLLAVVCIQGSFESHSQTLFF